MSTGAPATPSNTAAKPAQASEAQKEANVKMLMETLEEDDALEEFAAEDWGVAEKEEQTQMWVDNWDDDMNDDFTKNLRAELQKHSSGGGAKSG